MQVQKDLNEYELYSECAPCASKFKGFKSKILNKILSTALLLIIAVAVVASAVWALNVAFDNSVWSFFPSYSIKTPGYSSKNNVFVGFDTSVTFSVYDRGAEELVLSSDVCTIGQVFKKQNIELDDSCVVNYPLDQKVFEGIEIVIDSITYEEVEVVEVIPRPVTTIEVQTIPKNTTNVITPGADGSAVRTYNKKYVNGVFDSSELLDEDITLEPVTEVRELGVGGTFVGKDGIEYDYSYYIDVIATCYGPNDGASGTITATGTTAREGIIAVDPKTIPLGSKVYVTSEYRDLGVLSAEDTGGYIKGNRIDIFFTCSLQELLEFGRREMRAYIIE